MHTFPVALAWEFQRQHRWGLAILLLYLAVVLVVVASVAATDPSPAQMAVMAAVAATAAIPLAAAFMLMVAVFSFGFQGDLSGRESIYPNRKFTLPVRTAALSGWPMLYGTA